MKGRTCTLARKEETKTKCFSVFVIFDKVEKFDDAWT